MESKSAVLLALGLTGAVSMIYEIVLIKELIILLGPTEVAASLVLAAFMAGLALGSWRLGRLADKYNPINLFIILEISLAIISIIILPWVRWLKILPSLALFPSVFITMLVPAFFMGGEIPIASKILTKSKYVGTGVGTSYATDTLGGVFGGLIGGLLIVPMIGDVRTMLVCALLNAIGAALLLLVRK